MENNASQNAPLGYKPLLSLNDEPEQAIRTLQGVSCVLATFAAADDGSMNHRNAPAMFEMLAGVTDACTETLAGSVL